MKNGDSEPSLGGKPGEPVPEVDLADLKKVWQLYDETAKSHPGEHFAIGLSVLEQVCKPGANVRAVGYRCGQLSLLQLLSQQKGVPGELTEMITPLVRDGEFIDAAFGAITKVPMEWMQPGVIREGPPYDFNQFLKLCAA